MSSLSINKESFKRYGVNTGFLVLEKVLRLIVAVFVWGKVVEYLGPFQYGLLSYAVSYVFLFSVLSDLSLEAIVVRELLTQPSKENRILGSAFGLQVWGSIATIILIAGSAFLLPIENSLRWLIILISSRLLFQPFRCIDYYYRSKVLSKFVVIAQILSLVISAVLCLFFILKNISIVGFAWITVIEFVIGSLGFLYFYFKQGGSFKDWQFDQEIAWKLLVQCWPLVVAGIAAAFFQRIDQIMVKEMIGPEALGYYAAAVRISEAFYFIPVAITSSLFPAIVKSREGRDETYKTRLEALFGLLCFMAVGICLFMTLIAPWLIRFVYGPQFGSSVGVLMLYIWSCLFIFLGTARTQWAIAEHLQVFVMGYLILGAVVNVVLNLILIPKYSIYGAAFATLISYSISAILSNAICLKTRPIFWIQLKAFNPLVLKNCFPKESNRGRKEA